MADDLSAYEGYRGSRPPAIERVKYDLTRQADYQQRLGQNREAAATKRALEQICRSQGKHRDAHLLSTDAHRLESKGNRG